MEDLAAPDRSWPPRGLPEEPTVPEVVASGVDLVTFSGDKLLGGPQAGILVGKATYIDAASAPLKPSHAGHAALEATLKFIRPEHAIQHIPSSSLRGTSAMPGGPTDCGGDRPGAPTVPVT